MRKRGWVLWAALVLACASPSLAEDYAVGAEVTFTVRRKADGSDLGIPLHRQVGVSSMFDRLPSGSTATIVELGAAPHANWIKVRSADKEGWVIKSYVEAVRAAAPADDTGGGDGATYVIGCWNLEHFKRTSPRGFPENRSGGPTYEPRSRTQVQAIARVITEGLTAQLLVLNEISGRAGEDEDGDQLPVSDELGDLVAELPAGWRYVIASSGEAQRVALLYNTATVDLIEVIEFEIPPRRIQEKDIFERDPLAAHVRLKSAGEPRNDLVVVCIHLASGQDKNRNHDAAMEALLERLAESQRGGELGGESEHDIVIMGDYNANMFRGPAEQFFIDMDAPSGGPWDVLAAGGYPATRLSGVPLRLDRSQIDYVIASRAAAERRGLMGEEIAEDATVHTELVDEQGGPDAYRRDLSDHLPVTVRVRLMADTDR